VGASGAALRERVPRPSGSSASGPAGVRVISGTDIAVEIMSANGPAGSMLTVTGSSVVPPRIAAKCCGFAAMSPISPIGSP